MGSSSSTRATPPSSLASGLAAPLASGSGVGLQRRQKGEQVRLLSVGETDREPLVVEADDVFQRGRRPVVEVRRPGGNPAEDGALEPADVLPLSGEQGPAGVGGGLD